MTLPPRVLFWKQATVKLLGVTEVSWSYHSTCILVKSVFFQSKLLSWEKRCFPFNHSIRKHFLMPTLGYLQGHTIRHTRLYVTLAYIIPDGPFHLFWVFNKLFTHTNSSARCPRGTNAKFTILFFMLRQFLHFYDRLYYGILKFFLQFHWSLCTLLPTFTPQDMNKV